MTIRNLTRMFAPQSVALIGDIHRSGEAGRVAAENLVKGGFAGEIVFVNKAATSIQGYPAFDRVEALPKAPDLAVVTAAPPDVPALIAELGKLGTRAVVAASSGFWGLDTPTVERLSARMLAAAGPHLLRIVGPNTIGLMVPRANLNASCSHIQPLPGRLAFVTQSNAVLSSVLDWATHRRIGFSHCVCLGHMPDVDFGDMLDYLANDYLCRAILLYVETIHRARKFMSATRSAARMKPVILVKAGRFRSRDMDTGEDGAAPIKPDDVCEAAFMRAGVLRVNDLQALFDAVTSLSMLQPISGNRLAVLTNGGGIGTMCMDALFDKGGNSAVFSVETLQRLDAVLPPIGSRCNPVDIRPDAGAERYAAALEALMADGNVDAVLVLNAPSAGILRTEIAEAVVLKANQLQSNYRRCGLLSCWLGGGAAQASRQLFLEKGIPSYETPQDAVRGFMQMFRYRRSQEVLMETPPNIPEDFVPQTDRARHLIHAALTQGRSRLDADTAMALLAAYRIPVAEVRHAATPEAAAEAAAELGEAVTLTIRAETETRLPGLDGVVLNLETPETVLETAAAMAEQFKENHPGVEWGGFVVRPYMPRADAQTLRMGMRIDDAFGPILYFGQGGVAGEAMPDMAVTLPPLNMKLAREAVSRTRIFRLLSGFRGRAAVDLDAVAFTLVKLSQVVCDFAEITFLDIDPLLASPTGVLALNGQVGIAAATVSAADRLAVCPYPKELEEEVRLPDGTRMLLRPIRPEDEPAYSEVFDSLSPEAVRYRFLHPMKMLPHSQAARLTQIDYDREMAFVLAGKGPDDRPRLHGSVRLTSDPDRESAEFAILLRGDMTGLGLGPMLMRRIIDYARSQGIQRIHGDVLGDNRSMLRLCTVLGFKQKRDPDDPGVIKVTLQL